MTIGRKALAALLALTVSLAGLGTAPAGAAARSRIVFAYNGSLLAMSPGGRHLHRIARAPEGTLDMSASRDGRRIALISNRKLAYPKTGSVRTILLYRAGHGVRVVRRLRTRAPLWIAISPNGRQIAFGREGEIWVMRADGGHPRQVTSGPSTAWDAAYTPDGRSLVFDRDESRTPRLRRQRIAGGPEARLTKDEARTPAISSDGRLVYMRGGEGPQPDRLIVMRLDGSGRHTVARFDDPVFDRNPAWSPDGQGIAYMRLWETTGYAASYRYSIHTMSAAGRDDRKILGGLRSTAKTPPFAGHGPAGPLWTRAP
jgi:Tol biopolymer transport system component